MVEDAWWISPQGCGCMPLRASSEQVTESSRHRIRLTPARARAALQLLDLMVIVTAALLAHHMCADAPENGALLSFVVACAILVALDLFAVGRGLPPTAPRQSCCAVLARRRGVDVGSGPARHVRVCVGQRRAAAVAIVHGSGGPSAWPRWWRCTWPPRCWSARGQRAGWLATQLVLVGAGPQAAQLHPPSAPAGSGDRDRGPVRRSPQPRAGHGRGLPGAGTLDDSGRVRRAREHVDQIVITLPQHAASRRLACFEKLRHLPVDVRLSPDLPGLELDGHGMTQIAGVPLLRVFDRPLTGWSRLAKGIEDRVIAGSRPHADGAGHARRSPRWSASARRARCCSGSDATASTTGRSRC